MKNTIKFLFFITVNTVFSQQAITDTGTNVGIGVTSPTQKLDVNGNIQLSQSGLIGFKDSSSNFMPFIKRASDNYLQIGDIDDWFFGIKFTLWNSEEKMRIDGNGNVGIGTTTPVSKLNVYESIGLGGTSGNSRLLTRISGSTISNNVMENNWLLRDANGSDWLTARFHNGLSVDGSFLTPGVDTRTWWERDPFSGSQYWGDGAETQMTLIDGDLGIGTTTPASKLEVKSTNNLRTLLNFNDQSSITFMPNNGNSVFHISHGLSNNLHISQGVNPGDGKLMTIKNTGYIGIGTTDPKEKLQIGNSYTFHDGGHKVLGFMYGASGAVDLSSTQYAAELRFDPALGNLSLGTSSTITNTPITHMAITKEGYIGIGTTDTKGFKLGVQGKIAAEEVKVAMYSNWADFVFENSYNLPTLKEVEQHIKDKGHLKDIPSASEVKENGIFLGEMDSKLLQKIEELTLYTIEQQKEIEILKKENSKFQLLSKRLEDIEKLLGDKK